ncbi:hypothetical protein LPW11_10755 [Geomonas sp. RF6]|uniref:hypothetical protein n=1 Tax=Geomonas sp. RF6 TaxID=2897342 RepID=UPI001E35E72D|nr:hypothetical protein [Geomonas sp. RF6]UFS72653.1 hypothetical protein LPW11_10755 [Geomonas sp. RF6]
MRIYLFLKSFAELNTNLFIERVIAFAKYYNHEIGGIHIYNKGERNDPIGSIIEMMNGYNLSQPTWFLIHKCSPGNPLTLFRVVDDKKAEFTSTVVIYLADSYDPGVFNSISENVSKTHGHSLHPPAKATTLKVVPKRQKRK